MYWPSIVLCLIQLFALAWRSSGFVPAQAVNVTDSSTFDVHDNSTLSLTWNPNGGYTTVISYQQSGNGSHGISKGALIRVKEGDIINNATSQTPWIALIGCDYNVTNMSLDVDIFTMVRDGGARAALLYSNTSDGCEVNYDYLNSGEFEQIFDIFTAKKATTAILIQSQFNNINYSHTVFNATLLNQSLESVQHALPRTAVNNSPYLIATLRAANATGEEDPNDENPIPTTSPDNPQVTAVPSTSSDTSQSTAMIILYVIISLVATLFFVVIISGAVRAFKHPERYGPRLYDPTMDGEDGQGQNRAIGIGRAILDTFPIVKFGRDTRNQEGREGEPTHELKPWNAAAGRTRSSMELLSAARATSPNSHSDMSTNTSAVTTLPVRQSGEKRKSGDAKSSHHQSQHGDSQLGDESERGTDDLDPAAIGKETCPICIVDFEEGDDLRVLPCEGHHRFHKDCVDPWLLELSTSCPICREDFAKLESMAAAATSDDPHDEGDEQEDDEQYHQERHDHFPSRSSATTPSQAPSHSKRWTRYIQFAQKRRRSQRDASTSVPRRREREEPDRRSSRTSPSLRLSRQFDQTRHYDGLGPQASA